MLIVRGTKKLRDRVKQRAEESDASTTVLGDWFATALFWKPQVALLVNERTFVPVFMPLAPAATLLDRAPAAIATILRRHGVDENFIADELEAMRDVRLAPTNNRSVLGVMNGFESHGAWWFTTGRIDLEDLSMELAQTPIEPLRCTHGISRPRVGRRPRQRSQQRHPVPDARPSHRTNRRRHRHRCRQG